MQKVLLRRLQKEDAEIMLEWMHNQEICGLLGKNFQSKTQKDCEKFIEEANRDYKQCLHLAVCDLERQYLGTVSLKNIDRKNKTAEFAIVLTQRAIGKGVAQQAVNEILQIGFEQYELYKIYLCVSKVNIRAVRFYEKSVFNFEAEFKEHLIDGMGKRRDLLWYSVTKREWEASKNEK